MKFTCLQENLSKGLNTVSKAVSAKPSLPILLNVLIVAKNGRVQLSATNLDTTITTFIGASIEEDGATTVPIKLFRDFISNLSPSTISVGLSDDILNVTCGRTKAKFNGISAKDFPEIPFFTNDIPFLELKPEVFGSIIGSVAFAASKDNAHPVFSGLYLNFNGSEIVSAATDGFRLSERRITLESTMEPFSVLLPAKSIMEVARIFATGQEPVKIGFNKSSNLAIFECEDTCISTRILEGTFPDYKRIIPEDSPFKAEFSAEALLEAARLASLFAEDTSSAIKLSLNPEGFISLTSVSQEAGQHDSQIEATVIGDPITVIFNSKYLLEFLANAKFDRLLMETEGNTTPCLIHPEESGFLHLIIPIQS